jgi:hypothetical protein
MDDTLSVARRRRLSALQRAGLAVQGAIVVALGAAYVLVAPASRWDPVTIVALAALGVIAIRSEVALPSGITLEALSALGLIAVALCGPLPALVVMLVPIVVNAVCGRERLLRAGNLANLAAYGGYVLAGALVLEAAPAGATSTAVFGWVLIAGLVQLAVNWAFGPAIYVTCWLGQPVRTAFDILRDGVPVGAVMAILGAGTVVLEPVLGLPALALFAVIAVLPQSFLSYAARTRPVARLDHATATRRYAHAIAVQLGLSRAERRHVADVAAAARRRPATGDPIDYVHATLGSRAGAAWEAQLVSEWWNGRGGPIGLHGAMIPIAARVLAVAQTWSQLTARDTPELAHHDAIAHLQSAAGARLDPTVVRAARAVIAQERVTATEPAPEPRLHHLRVPAPLRRALAGA